MCNEAIKAENVALGAAQHFPTIINHAVSGVTHLCEADPVCEEGFVVTHFHIIRWGQMAIRSRKQRGE